jgi:hypothetical protein
MESDRAAVAAMEAEARRALGPQIVEDAKRLVAAWNERQSYGGFVKGFLIEFSRYLITSIFARLAGVIDSGGDYDQNSADRCGLYGARSNRLR